MRARPPRRATRAVLLLAALAPAAGGCSDGGPTAADAPTSTVAPSTTVPEAPCPSSSRLSVTRMEATTEHEISTAAAIVSDDEGVGTIVLTLSDAPLDDTAVRSDDDPVLAGGQLLLRIRASNAAGSWRWARTTASRTPPATGS